MKHNSLPTPSIEDDIAANYLIMQNIQTMELPSLAPQEPLLPRQVVSETISDDEVANRRVARDVGRFTLRNILQMDPVIADIQDNNRLVTQLDTFLQPVEQQPASVDKRRKKLVRSLFRLAA